MKKLIIAIIALLCAAVLVSCDSPKTDAPETDAPETDAPESIAPEEFPGDFRFILTWNTYGISYYDSGTGELVKTTDATHPEDYVTELRLTHEQLQTIYNAVAELDLDSYPDGPENYDPFDGGQSKPSQTVILTLFFNSQSKTIQAKSISYGAEPKTEEGKAFINVRDVITEIIYTSDEWKALPDYEFYYD